MPRESSSTLLLVPTQMESKILGQFLPPAGGRFEPCGFGPIVAAARTAQQIAQTRPDRVLLAGIAGTYVDRVRVGRAYVFETAGCYGIGVGSGSDFRTATEMGWASWNSDNDDDSINETITLDVHGALVDDLAPGMLLTVTSAAASAGECEQRINKFPSATAEDMEAYGVAVACQLAGVPLTVVRGISNQAGDREKSHWKTEAALQSVADLLSRILDE